MYRTMHMTFFSYIYESLGPRPRFLSYIFMRPNSERAEKKKRAREKRAKETNTHTHIALHRCSLLQSIRLGEKRPFSDPGPQDGRPIQMSLKCFNFVPTHIFQFLNFVPILMLLYLHSNFQYTTIFHH